MRVHGDKVIQRRKGVPELKHYSDGRDILEQDFYNLCGYCGKNKKLMYEHFQIDHFVPKSLDSERVNDYYNLVLACPRCNRAKWNKWPTKDKSVSNDGKIGFIDPATDEFDKHIIRNEEGYVEGMTELGKNMCHDLNLDIRRTDLFWKISLLYQQQEELEARFRQNALDETEKDFYIKSNIFLKDFINQAVIKGE